MNQELDRSEIVENRAYVVGIKRREDSRREAEEHRDEMMLLLETLDVEVVASEMASAERPTAALLIGTGKIKEIKASVEMAEANLIVVDDALSSAQQANWEKATGMMVIDRQEVILGIFAERAQTKEARLQVDLARQEYMLPRLKRAWSHLERQRGGGGFTGGPGEAQIELDRRIVRERIAHLKKELQAVRQRRATQRKARRSVPVPTAAFVGYTNVGKSSLFNVLTGSGVLEENKLFATLDPTTRRIDLPNSREVLATDTVGFIRKLPHQLVEAFKATLEETQLSDLIVHVVDASHPAALEHLRTAREVLKDLGVLDKQTLYVLNKIDLVEDVSEISALRAEATPNVITSSRTGEGIEELRQTLADFTTLDQEHVLLRIPPDRHDLISFVHREGKIHAHRYQDSFALFDADLPMRYHDRIAPYLMQETSGFPGEAS